MRRGPLPTTSSKRMPSLGVGASADMERTLLIRAGALYVPIMLLSLLAMRRVRSGRQVGAMLMGLCWCLPSLLTLQFLNLRFQWWSFHPQDGLIRGMPVDLYFSWALLWGALPPLAFPRHGLWKVIVALLVFDLLAMPACSPVIELSSKWLAGELLAIVIVLLPSILFSR